MIVETTGGDLGEEDISKPTVAEVLLDGDGAVEKIVVAKGVLFRKEIEIPAERIAAVEPGGTDGAGDEPAGKVVIAASEAETDALAPGGVEALAGGSTENEAPGHGLLGATARAVPTDAGMRELETGAAHHSATAETARMPGGLGLLRLLGPGLLAGIASNDASAVTTYAVTGARLGYGPLWLALLAAPLAQAIQFACAAIGNWYQLGLTEILQQRYGRGVSWSATGLLVVANVVMLGANLVAVGSGLELISGISWSWFVVPIALLLWYVTVYQSFDAIKRIFLLMSLAFVAYPITALLSGADWGRVLSSTLVPAPDFTFAGISSAVAVLGAALSPYQLFWQVQGEKEERRPGNPDQQRRIAAFDILSGVISGRLVAYFIIVGTAATIYTHNGTIATAVEAASSLEPLLGPAAKYLFAVGLIGAALVAIPILLASTSYAVAGTVGWPAGLAKRPWQREGFYLILTLAMVAGLLLSLMGVDPVQLMFWANVLQGVLSPGVLALLLLIGNNRKEPAARRLGWWTNIGVGLGALLLVAAVLLLFYGIATGQN